LGDYLLYYLAKGLGFIFRLMPVGMALFIGRRLGLLSMSLNSKRRRIAYANLKAAFRDTHSLKELKAILKKTYANIGQGIIEILILPKLDKRHITRCIKFEDFHHAEEALKKGKGFIFLTGHFGTWEMSHIALPFKGFPYTGIAREQKPYLLNELLDKHRESGGCRIISKGPAVKEAFRALKSNRIVGMLVDQDAGKNGVLVDLFGRKASWNPGVMDMALKTGAVILPGFAAREKGPYIRFKVFDPIKLPESGDREEIIKEGFRQYISCLEEMIKAYPDQWLWQHRRWKSTPSREVLILNDTRTGHLRQSEAVAYKLRDIWHKKGNGLDDLKIRILDVRFRRKFYKGLLRFSLEPESYRELMKTYADIVISCGSSTAGVNLLVSRENNAKSVVIMKPSLINIKRFDLAIVPRHDNPVKLKNVVVTDGALNLINHESLQGNSQELNKITGTLKKRVIGVLIGGPAKDFKMDKDLVGTLLDELIKAASEYDADILLTTSRRTPGDVEELLRMRLGRNPDCKLLIIANEDNIEGAVEGIIGLSDIVLVSQESISMISEAASSDAYTIVFRQRALQDKRHEAFLKNMAEGDYVKVVNTGETCSAISDVFKNSPKQNILDDSGRIEDALAGLF